MEPARAWRSGRIKHCKGEPFRFHLHTHICFLDLPREIRDRIYHEALVAPIPLTVCTLNMTPDHRPYLAMTHREDKLRSEFEETYLREPKEEVLDTLALNLFRTSMVISREAKEVFYRWNTFRFGGKEVWNPLYGFLRRIDETSRGLLRNIEVEMQTPEQLETDEHGVRIITRCVNYPYQRVVSCGHRDVEDYEQGAHFLDPAIEACFRILGKREAPLEMKLFLQWSYLPGVNTHGGENDCAPWYSMEIPDYIESARSRFATSVNVLWVGATSGRMFKEKRTEIEERGWNILETEEEEIPHPFRTVTRLDFAVQRKPFV